MPVYQPDPRYFVEAVESVLAQTLQDLELIIVEDPSPSSGKDLLKHLSDPRIRHLVNPKRTSLARQHNLAVSLARAEFIARFDADDVCEPERLAKQYRFLIEHPDVAVVGSQVRVIDHHGKIIGSRRYPLAHEEIRRALHRVNPLSGSNVMFRAYIALEAGGWLETTATGLDYEWYSRLASLGFRFANLPDYLVRYRLHADQIKTKRWRNSLRTGVRVKRRYWWKEMSLVSRLYMLLEVFALFLPTPLARLIFRLVKLRRPADPSPQAVSSD